jgi:hypothetical protein
MRDISKTVAFPFLALAVAIILSSAAVAASLPSVPSGARPGPDVLYAPAPAAPQLENRDPRFQAPPLLVSGQEAYVAGEYLYQDFLYDDYGSDTDGADATPLSPRVGNIDYPTNTARYGGNAADLVELRIARADDSVAYRITLNTLLEPDSTIIVIAYDTDHNVATGAATLPRDPGAPFPGTDEAITIWGTGAEHTRFSAVGTPTTTALGSITTDLEANQITVTVPRTVSNPSGTWQATVAVGLYDPTTGGWLRPQQSADATHPGGAGLLDLTPAGIFNLAFRSSEAFVNCQNPPNTQACDVPPDTNQSVAIRNKTPTTFAHDIDFAKLDAGVTESTVPATGLQMRIFASRLDLGEGRVAIPHEPSYGTFPQYHGQLQPYSLYIPSTYSPGTPAGLTLLLHSLGEHYWQYTGGLIVQQIGEARGNLVATTLGRGPDGWYQHEAEYDVFEVWSDVAARFTLDPDRTVSSGYSMGGYATYRLPTLYPDLFGKAFSQVGPPGDGIWVPPAPPTGGLETLTNLWLENARNIPYLNVVAASDELVPIAGTRAQNLGAPEHGIRGFDQLGYRFRFLIFSPSDHLAQASAGYNYPFSTDFLGDGFVDRNPPHVTFAYVPAADDPALGLVHDHAYWVSQVQLTNPTGGTAPGKGVIDARSHGFGVGDPPSTSGATAGAVPPFTYTENNRTWGPAPATPVENVLDVTLTNVGSARIDTARASLDSGRTLVLPVTADTDALLHLDGAFPTGSIVLEDGQVLAGGAAGPGGADVPVASGTHTYTITEPFELRRVRLALAGAGEDRLDLKGRLQSLLAQIGLPGPDVTITLRNGAGQFFTATVPASALVANGTLTKLRFRDRTGTIAGGVTGLVIGGRLFTDVKVKARNVNLAGASAGPFTALLTIGERTFAGSGVLRPQGTKLVHP